jgi:hypothetical protein
MNADKRESKQINTQTGRRTQFKPFFEREKLLPKTIGGKSGQLATIRDNSRRNLQPKQTLNQESNPKQPVQNLQKEKLLNIFLHLAKKMDVMLQAYRLPVAA